MVSMYEMKKVKIDFIITIYLILITLLNVFMVINKTVAFATGVNINTNVARGFSLSDLVVSSPSSKSLSYELLIVLLFVPLFVLLILHVLDYLNMKKNNQEVIKKIQIVSAILYFVLIVVFALLFSNGTQSADYKTIRIYGTGLFGIVGLVSFIALGVLEIYWVWKTLSSEQTKKTYQQITKTNPQRQPGMILIIIYQILVGVAMLITGVLFYVLANMCITITALGGCQDFTPDTTLELMGVLTFLWGLVGIISAFLLIFWNYYGYLASWFFLITTGIILFEIYLVPTVCMIIALYYYRSNKQFKESIKFIKSQRHAPKNVQVVQ